MGRVLGRTGQGNFGESNRRRCVGHFDGFLPSPVSGARRVRVVGVTPASRHDLPAKGLPGRSRRREGGRVSGALHWGGWCEEPEFVVKRSRGDAGLTHDACTWVPVSLAHSSYTAQADGGSSGIARLSLPSLLLPLRVPPLPSLLRSVPPPSPSSPPNSARLVALDPARDEAAAEAWLGRLSHRISGTLWCFACFLRYNPLNRRLTDPGPLDDTPAPAWLAELEPDSICDQLGAPPTRTRRQTLSAPNRRPRLATSPGSRCAPDCFKALERAGHAAARDPPFNLDGELHPLRRRPSRGKGERRGAPSEPGRDPAAAERQRETG